MDGPRDLCEYGGMRYEKFAAAAAIALFALTCSTARADPAPTADSAMAFEHNLAKALVDNDPAALSRLLASDWVVVSARGGIADRDAVIDAVRKGLWVHKTVDISEPRVRIYGDNAVVTYRLANVGILGGKPFNVQERETDVLVWNGGVWKAVLSHESFLNE
jgi:hypothetical protein